ncbi:hypothetical protein VPH35_060772 [Triticum aestivum]
MEERWASGKGWGVAHDVELDGGLAAAQSARTCRISQDPVGYGAQAADLEGRWPELGTRRLAGASWPTPVREERDERERKERTGRRCEARGREKGVVVLLLLAGG